MILYFFLIAFGVFILAITKQKLKGNPMPKLSGVRKINEVKEGEYSKIVGIAQDNGQLVKAPFSEEWCLCYTVLVKTPGKYGWQTILEQFNGEDFYVKDQAGNAFIKISGSLAKFPNSYEAESGLSNDPDSHVLDYLKRFNIKHSDLFGLNMRMSFIEYYYQAMKF